MRGPKRSVSGKFALWLAVLLLASVTALAQQEEDPTVSFRNFRGASMLELVDRIAQQLGINYLVDPAVADGTVTINTYGELRQSDLRPLMESILRMNGAAIVEVGNIWRIVPLAGVAQTPILMAFGAVPILSGSR